MIDFKDINYICKDCNNKKYTDIYILDILAQLMKVVLLASIYQL